MTEHPSNHIPEARKMLPGDELHLPLLMAPFSLNFFTGQDRQHLLAFGRAAFEAGQARGCVMAKAKEAVDAQGWCRPNEDWPEHYFKDAYPACGWKLPIQTNENGRCIKCERAAQAVKQGGAA